MSHTRILGDAIGATFSTPLVSLAVAVLLAAVILFRPRRAPQTAPPGRYRAEHNTLAAGALAVILLVVAEQVIDGYLLTLTDVVAWWRYTTPLIAALLAIVATIIMITTRGTTAPDIPAFPTTRRSWTSFGPRVGMPVAAAVAIALLVTTLAAGSASSADDRGRFVWLEIPVPNEQIDPLRPWFFGWSYGIPVLICLAALVAGTWGALHSNAARPFRSPESVAAERSARRQTASGTIGIAIAGMLLTLAGAWRFISSAGATVRLTVGDSGSFDATWRYAEFAQAAGVLAPALEIAAFTILLLVASRALRRRERTTTFPQAQTAEVLP